ncbi:MAG: tRNA guanosine(15) transglycosylase TgtA [Thermoplasmatota archaeon]
MKRDEDVFSTAFEVRETDLAGRSGTYTVNGRKVETPELMPVVNPNKAAAGATIPPRELKEVFGFDIIITNSYIIRKSPDLVERCTREGVHGFLDYDGIIMTDSGTFQSYIYGGKGGKEVKVDPLEIISFQREIGSDIGTILDKFTVPERDHDGARRDLETTLQRAKDSLDLGLEMEIAVPVQGGSHLDLRKLSGRAVRDLGVGYAPIGGVVPIMESYDYGLLVDVIANSKEGLGPAVPVHLFGAGHPMILPLAAALGCDLFDSASYAKFAADDRYMTRHRTYHLKEMQELPCSCPVCSLRDPKTLLEMPKPERADLLSRHNLWVIRSVLNEVRNSIKEGTLWEFVERSASYNPSLYSAVRRLKEHGELLERSSPRSTRRFTCNTGLSLARPEFQRYRNVLETGIDLPGEKAPVMLTDWNRAHSIPVLEVMWNGLDPGRTSLVKTPLGPVPYDMIDMYPLSQSLFPDPGCLDPELVEWMEENMGLLELLKRDDLILWDGRGQAPIEPSRGRGNDLLVRKVSSILRAQLGRVGGKWADELMVPDTELLEIKCSRRTGKIRNVLERDGGTELHLLSMRAEDGLFNLRWEAARRLHAGSAGIVHRVRVEEGTGEFNAKGYNVFCRFVLEADPRIRAGDDVLIVGPEDELHAVGRAAVSSEMMVQGKNGIAVKVRDGAEKCREMD